MGLKLFDLERQGRRLLLFFPPAKLADSFISFTQGGSKVAVQGGQTGMTQSRGKGYVFLCPS